MLENCRERRGVGGEAGCLVWRARAGGRGPTTTDGPCALRSAAHWRCALLGCWWSGGRTQLERFSVHWAGTSGPASQPMTVCASVAGARFTYFPSNGRPGLSLQCKKFPFKFPSSTLTFLSCAGPCVAIAHGRQGCYFQSIVSDAKSISACASS